MIARMTPGSLDRQFLLPAGRQAAGDRVHAGKATTGMYDTSGMKAAIASAEDSSLRARSMNAFTSRRLAVSRCRSDCRMQFATGDDRGAAQRRARLRHAGDHIVVGGRV